MTSRAIILAVGVVAACAAGPLAHGQTPSQAAAQQHAVAGAIVTFDDRCRVLTPAQRAAMEATVREKATLSTPAERSAIQAATNALQQHAQRTSCVSPEGGQLAAQATRQGESQRVLWLARAAAAADLAAKNRWAATISHLGLVSPQLSQAAEPGIAAHPQGAQLRAGVAGEARAILARLCKINAPEAGCPNEAVQPPPALVYAWEQGMTAMAAQITPVIAKVPRGTASWSNVWLLRRAYGGTEATAASVRCTVTDHIFVVPPGTGTTPVRSRMAMPAGGYLPVEVEMVDGSARASFRAGDVPIAQLAETADPFAASTPKRCAAP